MIRVLVVDDHYIVRHELMDAIRNAPDMRVVADAQNGEEALDKCRLHQPDVVLMDLRMPRMSGHEATAKILKELPETRIIVLTAHSNDDDITRALTAGARSYLIKGAPRAAVLDAIRAVYSGELRIEPQVFARFIDQHDAPDLSDRERDVLRLIAGGKSNKEIAEALYISEGAARGHVAGVLEKLGAKDRTEAVMRALQRRLIASAARGE